LDRCFLRAADLADAAVSGRAVGLHQSVRATCISWISATSVAFIKVPIFSSADRGESGPCLEDLIALGEGEIRWRPTMGGPRRETSGPIRDKS
jgi:hypothetical protein